MERFHVLTLNAGSSSLRSALFAIDGEVEDGDAAASPEPLWQAEVRWQALPATVRMRWWERGWEASRAVHVDGHHGAASYVLEALRSELRGAGSGLHVDVVGHRVVHGGLRLREPVFVTPQVAAEIRKAARLAPEHNPAALAGVAAVRRILGRLPQVAVFDSAFHATLPLPAAVYPGPYSWYSQLGIRRIGFHGISHRHCAQRTAQLLKRDPSHLRIVSCHLGNGCSLSAVEAGRSVDTTMGFTPLEGVMMGSRAGSLDPGLLLYLSALRHYAPRRLQQILSEESGLKGLSGLSSDIRAVLAAREKGDERAGLAIDVYMHRLRAGIAAMVSAMGGLDAIAFTGGVGEHSPIVRSEVCRGLGFLGIRLDEERNRAIQPDAEITAEGAPVRALVVRANEEWSVACDAWRLVRGSRLRITESGVMAALGD